LTWSDVSRGPRVADSSTGRPVLRSVPSLGGRGRSPTGSRTMRPASRATSSVAPMTRPSFRRTADGRTICPLLDNVVFMV